MKIGVIICEELPAALRRSQQGSQAARFEQWLGAHLPNASFRPYLAYGAHLPGSGPECDAYIVTGSACSVNSGEHWLPPLLNFLRITARAQIPVVGVGFGHQAIAVALGGRVKKAQNWMVGCHELKIVREEGWLRNAGKKLRLMFLNSEQVDKLPSRSVRIATGNGCANGVYRVASHSVGIQAHPEYDEEYFRALLTTRTEIPAKQAAAAAESLAGPTHHSEVGEWCARFISSSD